MSNLDGSLMEYVVSYPICLYSEIDGEEVYRIFLNKEELMSVEAQGWTTLEKLRESKKEKDKKKDCGGKSK